jgi:hypothetical protein
MSLYNRRREGFSHHIKGGLHGVSTKTADYTLDAQDDVLLLDTTGGAFTVTLPSAVGNLEAEYTIKHATGTPFASVAASGSETIDGAASYTFSAQYESIQIATDGSNWQIMDRSGADTGWVSVESISLVPGYDNDWVDGANAPRIRRLRSGLVVFDGSIQSPTATQSTRIFALPAGWRPAVDKNTFVVATGGNVVLQMQAAAPGSLVYTSTTGLITNALINSRTVINCGQVFFR